MQRGRAEGGGGNTPQTEATVEPQENAPVQHEALEVGGGGAGVSVKPEEEAGDVTTAVYPRSSRDLPAVYPRSTRDLTAVYPRSTNNPP